MRIRFMTGGLVFGMLFAALLGAPDGARAASRGIAVTERATGNAVALYAESHALLIGVSDYTNGWPRLRGVADDIRAVRKALEAQGFAVEEVMDPDRDGMDRAFRGFIDRYGLKPDNRLLFYFAGHGHSMKMGYGGTMGYLVGRDAPNPNVDKAGFRQAALSMQVIETYARNIESKHALFMFDACFAGSVFDATRAIPDIIAEKTGRPVRQFITSGSADQQVPDQSLFRREFVAALAGEGDADGDGYVTGAELGLFLETKVTNYSRGAQTPQYGKLRDPLLDKGDFVFVLPEAKPRAQTTSGGNGTDREAQFWDSIHASTSGGDYCAYLETFPRGTFVALAVARARQYGGACARTSSEVRFDYDFKGGPYVRQVRGTIDDPRGMWNALAPLQPPKGAHGGYGLIGDDRLLGKESGYGLRRLGAVARRYVRFEKMHVEQPEGFSSIGVQSGIFTRMDQMNDTTLGWVLFDLRDKFEADLKKSFD